MNTFDYQHILDNKEKIIEINQYLKRLPRDIGERCGAMNLNGEQCEEFQGHKGKHCVTNKKSYFDIAISVFDKKD